MGRKRSSPRAAGPVCSKRGFTLIEAVIGVSIFGFFLLGVAGFLVLMERIEGENNVRASTLLCAQEKVEELAFLSLAGDLGEEDGSEALGEGPFSGLDRRWRIAPSSVAPGLLHVRARCSCDWMDRTVESVLETLMVNRE